MTPGTTKERDGPDTQPTRDSPSNSPEERHETDSLTLEETRLRAWQQQYGNRVTRDVLTVQLRPSLVVGPPEDAYEREATRVADAVMRTPSVSSDAMDAHTSMSTSETLGNTPRRVQRDLLGFLTDDEEDEPLGTTGDATIRRSETPSEVTRRPSVTDSGVRDYLQRSRGGGHPLGRETRAFMEPRLGHALDGVRVHTDGDAASAAQRLNARAFTFGRDIYFGAGQYQPHTPTGRRLLAHELVHTIQQGSVVRRQTAAEKSAMQQAIDDARERGIRQQDLAEVSFRAYVYGDRTVIHVDSRATPLVYPTQILKATSGYYLIKYNADGTYQTLWSLASGEEIPPTNAPVAGMKAGEPEWKKVRASKIGVFWFSKTVTKPPEPKEKGPDDIQFNLYPFAIDPDEFERLRQATPAKPLSVSGLTGGVFYPDYEGSEAGRPGYYGHPLNFTYYTHDGVGFLASRREKGVDREFYYYVPIQALSSFLRYYAFEYAGLAGRGVVTMARIMMEVGIAFIPVIGPLYGLVMATRSAYRAYHNWDKMTGWEKALVGLEVLLEVVPAIAKGVKIAKGAAGYRTGVESLVTAGLPKGEAQRLMLAAGVFQHQKSALRIVDDLGDVLRQGTHLDPGQLKQIQDLFHEMLQQLPAAERLAISAGFATRNLDTAREFLRGVDLSERHLVGLRRLAPETLVALRAVRRTNPEFVQQVALWAERSADVASGIDKLHDVAKPSHMVYIIGAAGEDVLEMLGRTSGRISDDLAAFVRKARGASDAYRRLMRGTTQGGRNVTGLAQLLSGARPQRLSAALQEIESQFKSVFLTTEQLTGLSRLNPGVRTALTSASESQVRRAATIAAQSPDAVRGLNEVAEKLLAQGLGGYAVGNVIYHTGGGIIEQVGKQGVTISDDLARAAAKKGGSAATLMMGRGGRYPVPGLLDELAPRIQGLSQLEDALKGITSTRYQAELFSRWAMKNPTLVDGIQAIQAVRPKDAQEKIAGIFSALGGDLVVAKGFFGALGTIHRVSGPGVQLERMVGELAAGGTKLMGASLTLTYAAQRLAGKITRFEGKRTVGSATREYDLVARGIDYEFKYWTTFGGSPARAAADEFARDVVIHAGTGFQELRWVISNDAVGYMPAIKSMMRGVLRRDEVRTALRAQGLDVDDVLAALNRQLDDGLLEFFAATQ